MKIVEAIVVSPPDPLNGEVLCDWHCQCHGGDPDEKAYREGPATYSATWQLPFTDKYEIRHYPAVEPEKIDVCLQEAFDSFEAYAREPAAKPELHKVRSAQVLAWLMSRLIRAWPFDTYNEELAQIAFQAATVRLGFQLFTLTFERLDIKQEVAYSIVPKVIQAPTVDHFVPRILENLEPLDPKAGGDYDGLADSLVSSHRAFSTEVAAANAESLNEGKAEVSRPSDYFLSGGNSRGGRRLRSRRRQNRQT